MKIFIEILQTITLIVFMVLCSPLLHLMSFLEKISNKISIKKNKLFESPIVNTKIISTDDSHLFQKPVYGIGPIYKSIFKECKRKSTRFVTYHNEILDSETIFLTIVQSVDTLRNGSIIITEDMVKHVEFMVEEVSDCDTNVDNSKFSNHRFLGFKKGTNIKLFSVPENILSGNKMLIGPAIKSEQFNCVIEKYEYKAGIYYFDGKLPDNISDNYACLEFTDRGYTIDDISFF